MIEIRPVTTIEECRHIEEITMTAWGGGHEVAVPDHMTYTIAKENGGVVLLAWDGLRPVGFCLGFLSYVEDGLEKRLKHCSHMAGVIPEYRGKRIGELLKWAQRDAVLAMGIDHITWTYDPLEALNGRLNIHKLGAVCNTYKRNVYGDGRDALNWGVPTDRFRVDWWLDSPRVQAHKDGTHQHGSIADWLNGGAVVVNSPHCVDDIWQPGVIDEDALAQAHVLVAIPRDYQGVKKASVALGLSWRMHTRQIFEQAFGEGFKVVDLKLDKHLCYYLLRK